MPKRIQKAVLLDQLRQRVRQAGTQKAFAASCGITQQYLSDVLSGRREPGPKLYRALGYLGTETVFLISA